jgi:hypothetical protein
VEDGACLGLVKALGLNRDGRSISTYPCRSMACPAGRCPSRQCKANGSYLQFWGPLDFSRISWEVNRLERSLIVPSSN